MTEHPYIQMESRRKSFDFQIVIITNFVFVEGWLYLLRSICLSAEGIYGNTLHAAKKYNR